jgi:hypothetical protein
MAAKEYEIETRMAKSGNPIEWVVIGSALYRVPNDDIASLKNTILKMSQKRAYVGAVMTGCNASEFFSQDLEDMAKETLDHVIEGHATAVREKVIVTPEAEAEREDMEKAGGKAPGGNGGEGLPPQGVSGGLKMAPPGVRKEKKDKSTSWLVNGKHWSLDAGLRKNFEDFLSLHGWQINDTLRVMGERMKKQFLGIEEIEAPVGEMMNAMLDWNKAETAKQDAEKAPEATKTEPGKLL